MSELYFHLHEVIVENFPSRKPALAITWTDIGIIIFSTAWNNASKVGCWNFSNAEKIYSNNNNNKGSFIYVNPIK